MSYLGHLLVVFALALWMVSGVLAGVGERRPAARLVVRIRLWVEPW